MTDRLPPFVPPEGAEIVDPRDIVPLRRKSNGQWSDDKYRVQLWHGDLNSAIEGNQYLVRGMIHRAGLTFIAGPTSSGKSFIVQDLAASVMMSMHADDVTFAGQRVDRPGGVLLLAAESAFQLPPRLAAMNKHVLEPFFDKIGITMPPLPLAINASMPDLAAPGAIGELENYVRAAQHEMHDKYNCELALVAIDTLSAAATFKDQNDAAEAQRVMSPLKRMAEQLDVAVVVIDHTGKDLTKLVRGTTAKIQAADSVLIIQASMTAKGIPTNLMMYLLKLRNGLPGKEWRYDLRSIEMGVDPDGEPITAGLLQWQLEQPLFTPRKRPPEPMRPLIDAMNKAYDHGYAAQLQDGRRVYAIPADEVRKMFFRDYPPTANPQSRNHAITVAWSRATKHKFARNFVQSQDYDGRIIMFRVDIEQQRPPMQIADEEDYDDEDI